MSIKLTTYSKASGCGCKISPDSLKEILNHSGTAKSFDSLLIGNEYNDDAAVINYDGEDALISTTDFFTPLVDDATDFGKIAACNAINDVYAMGGKPLMAIAILGWPINKLPPKIAGDVLSGAKQMCFQAGIPLAGGHSIDSNEPFFGLAVTGKIKTKNIKKNHSISHEDILYLTKPIGIGILSAALKRGLLEEQHYSYFLQLTTELNHIGELLSQYDFVHAITDVTGFGLVGHLSEMITPFSFKAIIEKQQIPIIPEAVKLAKQFVFPDNTTRNYNAFSKITEGLTDLDMLYYFDPQTSGGLLISVAKGSETKIEELFTKAKVSFSKIGHFEKNEEPKIVFKD